MQFKFFQLCFLLSTFNNLTIFKFCLFSFSENIFLYYYCIENVCLLSKYLFFKCNVFYCICDNVAGLFPQPCKKLFMYFSFAKFICPHGEVIFILLIFHNYYKKFTVKLITFTSIIDA